MLRISNSFIIHDLIFPLNTCTKEDVKHVERRCEIEKETLVFISEDENGESVEVMILEQGVETESSVLEYHF